MGRDTHLAGGVHVTLGSAPCCLRRARLAGLTGGVRNLTCNQNMIMMMMMIMVMMMMMMISTWSQLTPSVLVVGLVAAITKSLAASQLHCWIIM